MLPAWKSTATASGTRSQTFRSSHGTADDITRESSRTAPRPDGGPNGRPEGTRGIVQVMLVLVLALLATTPRFDAQVRQLEIAPKPATRAQAAKALGQSDRPEAVKPLCDALSDAEAQVVAASAEALQTLQETSALDCLRPHAASSDMAVRAAVQHAIASLEQRAKAKPKLLVALAPVRPVDVDAAIAQDAHETLSRHLALRGASVVPDTTTAAQARARERAEKLRGVLIKPTLTYRGGQLSLSLVCARYPGGNLLGEAEMSGSGAELEDIVHAMVDKLLDEARASCGLP